MPTTSTARTANDSPFCEAYAAMDKIVERLLAMVGEGATADDVTRLLASDGTALLRDLMQGYVDQCAARERRVEVVGSDGVERREARMSSRQIETPVGEIAVQRLLDQAAGVEGIAPLDAALRLPDEKYTTELRRVVAEESAKSSFDEVVELIAKRTGASVPKRQVEELVVRAAQDFDLFYRDRLREAETTDHLLVMSFDGKGIAMRLADLREATRKKAEAARANRTRTRLASGEKRQREAHGGGRRGLHAEAVAAHDRGRLARVTEQGDRGTAPTADLETRVGQHHALRATGDRRRVRRSGAARSGSPSSLGRPRRRQPRSTPIHQACSTQGRRGVDDRARRRPRA